jgi:broad specificity phosphatase PhoE
VGSLNVSAAKLVLIRHGATNLTGTFCGHTDPPLNSVGREQAQALARLSLKWNIGRIYSSDLKRAIETAHPIAAVNGLPILVRTELREISFGDWEGRRWSDLRADKPDIAIPESLLDFCPPGGEAFPSFRDRVIRILTCLAGECDRQTAAVVTHLGVIYAALNEARSTHRDQVQQYRIEHGSVYPILISRNGNVEVSEAKAIAFPPAVWEEM